MGRKVKSLAGQQFGYWNVICELPERNARGQVMWQCQCKCGTLQAVIGANLSSGQSTSCGCKMVQFNKNRSKDQHRANDHLFVDITGQKFSRWTVLYRLPNVAGNKVMWQCRCDCGTIRSVNGSNLRKGRSLSCGCLQKEANTAHEINHFMTEHPAYNSWCGMKNRCYNTNDQDFHHYGGRGIEVCAEWHSFKKFWLSMGPTWEFGLEIDRIDNDGNYEPGNCRWATREQQMNNTRLTILVTLSNGETLSLKQISKKYNLTYYQVKYRYHDKGLRGDQLIIPPKEE